MILYPVFYRRYGILRFDQLNAPRYAALSAFELPRESIVQYYPQADYSFGPELDEFWVRKADGQIYIEHVTKMTSMLGNPRPSMVYPNPTIQRYRKTHRRFRPMQNMDTASRDAKTIIVKNYAMVPHFWRYRANLLTGYYQWRNVRDTFWKGVEETANQSDRQQYVFVPLPRRLPLKVELNKAAAGINSQSLKAFTSPDALNVLDLWNWVGPNRDKSSMSVLSDDTLSKVNIVFLDSGRFSVINLGRLNGWRKTPESELGAIDDNLLESLKSANAGQPQGIVQFKLLIYLNALVKLRNTDGEVIADVVSTVDDDREIAVVEEPDTDDGVVIPTTAAGETKVEGKSKDTVTGKPVTVKTPVDQLADTTIIQTGMSAAEEQELLGDDLELDGTTVEQPDTPLGIEDEDDDVYADVEDDGDVVPPSASEEAWNEIGVVPDPRKIPPTVNLEEYKQGVLDEAKRLLDLGLITATEYRRAERQSSAFEKIPNPYGTGTLADLATIDPAIITDLKMTKFPDSDTIIDKSMLQSSIHDYDPTYVNTLMQRNIAQMVLQIQNSGIAVIGYQVVRVNDVMGSVDQYTVKVQPVRGKPSSIKFILPVIQPDGTYRIGGVRYRLRRQRGDLPIRKVHSNQVALTTYYGKIFVTRGERVVQNYGKWLRTQLQAAIVRDDSPFSHPVYGNRLRTGLVMPRTYSAIATQFDRFHFQSTETFGDFVTPEIAFYWDAADREGFFGQDILAQFETDEMVVVGRQTNPKKNEGNGVVTMDFNGVMYLNGFGGTTEVLGSPEELFGFNLEKAPIEYCELKLFGKPINVGFALAYHYGLGALCKMLGVTPRRVPRGGQLNLEKDEWVVRFKDETLVFNRDNRLATHVLAGLKTYQRQLMNYSVLGFDGKEVYGSVLAGFGLGQKYLRELDQLKKQFVDHIAKQLLIMQNEPTNWTGLLLRSCELLLTDDTPDETDHLYQIEKSYERLSGAVYQEIIRGLRSFGAVPASPNNAIAIPYGAVAQALQNDSAQILVEESNPIHNLKEKEANTFNGSGGRTGRTMSKKTRVFHPNDRGIISEATVDNSDVAVNTYLTANPGLSSLYGTIKKFDRDNQLDDITSQLSTSALVSPCATNDDPKRTNFISIQHSSGMSARGYSIQPMLTGYEQIIPHRVDDGFCYTAKADGVVVKRDREHIHVTYPGTDIPDYSVQIGTRFGVAAGSVLPHEIVTSLRTGDTFKFGDAIAYNKGFFAPDPMNEGRVAYMHGCIARVLWMESADTTDDSSAISLSLSEKLGATTGKIRTLLVDFNQAVRNIVEPGDVLEADSVLCNIEDALTANYDLFSDSNVDALRSMSANSPRAKFPGKVHHIEVVYNGDIEKMSPSLRMLTEECDARMASLSRKLKRGTATTGQVVGYGRIDGTTLETNKLAIRIYMTGEDNAEGGDKGVIGNQLKTVFRRVLLGKNETVSGKQIECIFGLSSADNRIVTSPMKVGTTNTLLIVGGERMAEIYRKG